MTLRDIFGAVVLSVVWIFAFSATADRRYHRVPRRAQTLARALGATAVTSWWLSLALHQHFVDTPPNVAVPAAGRTYRIFSHGVTRIEYLQFKGLWVATALFATAAVLVVITHQPEAIYADWNMASRGRAAAIVIAVGLLLAVLLALVPT